MRLSSCFRLALLLNSVAKFVYKSKESAPAPAPEPAPETKAKKKAKPEWGRVNLVEDQYPSTDSDEGAEAMAILKKKQAKNILN